MTTNLNIFSCVLHISDYKKQFSTCCPYLTKTIISQCRTYNVPNLCIYIPIFSAFNTICYSFMVHSFHRAALILLPVSQNCYRYLKNAVQYFFAEIYIVMVLICFHLVNFHTYETFPISDLSQDFWYININFIFTEIQNTM